MFLKNKILKKEKNVHFIIQIGIYFHFLVLMVLKEYFTFEKTFADNLLTPMSSKMSMLFFLQSKRNQGF